MDWNVILREYGLPTALLVAVGFAAWKICTFLAMKLFADPSEKSAGGLFTQLSKRHLDFVDAVQGSQTRNEQTLAAVSEAQQTASLALAKLVEQSANTDAKTIEILGKIMTSNEQILELAKQTHARLEREAVKQ